MILLSYVSVFLAGAVLMLLAIRILTGDPIQRVETQIAEPFTAVDCALGGEP